MRVLTAWSTAFGLCLSPAALPAGEQGVLDEVLITGSRIPDVTGSPPRALVVVSRDDLGRVGAESLGDTLQRLPLNNGSPPNTNSNADQEDRGGDGSTRIDLRGLGPERTLVLVDGRRLVPGGLGGDTSVDLGMIPLNAVERIEVLGAGSSSVYGTDAIGGVVNVITRRPGAGNGDAVLSGSTTSRADAGSILAGLTGSHVSRHGSMTGGLEWFRQQAVWMRDRAYSRQRELLLEDGSPVAFGLAQTPEGYFRVPPSNTLGLPGGTYTRVDGSTDPAGPDDFRRFVEPDDRYNPNEDEYLRTPLDRWSLWVNGDYEVGAATRLGLAALLHARRSAQELRPAPVDTRFGIGIPQLPVGRPGIPTDHYYNPFGIDMLDVRRRLVEAGPRRFEQDMEAGRLLATIGGTGGSGWDWEAALGWSRSSAWQRTTGELRADRLVLALGPSGPDSAGRIVCGAPDPVTGRVPDREIIQGCVPLNVFGGQGADGSGTVGSDQLGYLTDTFHDRGRNEQWIADLGAHGVLGRELAAGPAGWAAGLEYRHESGLRRVDPDKLAGVAGSVSGDLSEGGEYWTVEAFGEVRIPLLADKPAIEELGVEASVRWSHFSSFGSTVSSAARVNWQPIVGLTVHGGYSEVFRAPPLAGLHTLRIDFLGIPRDPCGNGPDPVQRAHCAASGVPGGSYVQLPFDQTPVVRGGNPDLLPELGYSWSIGLGWTPQESGLTVRVEHWTTSIRSAIRQLRDQTLLDACASTGAAPVCERITRWPDGSLRVIDARYLNVGRETASGTDFEVRQQAGIRSLIVDSRLLLSHLEDRALEISSGAAPLEIAGTKFERGLYPRWRALGGLDLTRGRWSAGYLAEYVDGVRECSTSTPPVPGALTGCRLVGSILYHDLRLGYGSPRGWSATLLATNVTDEDPPRVAFGPAEGNTSTVTYRLLGRTYSLQLRASAR